MKTFLNFMSESPFVSLFAILFISYTIVEVTAIIVLHHTVTF